MRGRVVSVNISDRRGIRKKQVQEASIKREFGIEGDAHASAKWHRQVSLLALESIKKMQAMGLKVDPGDFAENITTEGIELFSLPIGTRMEIGNSIEAEVTQIGKACHTKCEIYTQAGACIMPKEGIFVKILKGGKVKVGDTIVISREEAICKKKRLPQPS
ncbi:MAG: MOSC domain-containing protein [Thermodesulfovibrionales bacterium]|nr:MOSC domain-containing protein [Thermodesulfovibrionales bacterium]